MLSEVSLFQTRSIPEVLTEALPVISTAITLGPQYAGGHVNNGIALVMQGQCELAAAEGRRAVSIDPNHAGAHLMLGNALSLTGRPREAIEAIHTGLRHDPHAPQGYIARQSLVMAYYFLREYENSFETAREVLRSYPDHPWADIWLAAALGQLGRLEEAGEALKKAMALKAFDSTVRRRPPYNRPEDHEHKLEGLRKAGWQG